MPSRMADDVWRGDSRADDQQELGVWPPVQLVVTHDAIGAVQVGRVEAVRAVSFWVKFQQPNVLLSIWCSSRPGPS